VTRVAALLAYASAAGFVVLLVFTDPRTWPWPVVGLAVLLIGSAAVAVRGHRGRS
jgi:hypothetical protein